MCREFILYHFWDQLKDKKAPFKWMGYNIQLLSNTPGKLRIDVWISKDPNSNPDKVYTQFIQTLNQHIHNLTKDQVSEWIQKSYDKYFSEWDTANGPQRSQIILDQMLMCEDLQNIKTPKLDKDLQAAWGYIQSLKKYLDEKIIYKN